jgi:hypothetical protein
MTSTEDNDFQPDFHYFNPIPPRCINYRHVPRAQHVIAPVAHWGADVGIQRRFDIKEKKEET